MDKATLDGLSLQMGVEEFVVVQSGVKIGQYDFFFHTS